MNYGCVFSGISAPTVAWQPLGWQCKFFAENAKFPSAVLKHHYPEVPNYGDIRNVPDSAGAIDVLVGGSPCFPAGTLVLCERGLVPIEEVKVGDLVLTHAGAYRRVLRTGSTVSKTLTLIGQGHNGLECTAEHPIFSISFARSGFKRDENGKQHPSRKFDTPKWVEARNMVGRFWGSPTQFPQLPVPEIVSTGRKRSAPLCGREFFWMLGAFLGNGWTRSGQRHGRADGETFGTIIICTGKHKSEELGKRLAATGLEWSRSSEPTAVKFATTSIALRRWLDEHFGKYAHGKTVPAWVLGAQREFREQFLDGYLFTDGCIVKKHLQFSTVSKSFAMGIKLMLHSLGYSVTLSKNIPSRVCIIEGRTVSERPCYVIRGNKEPRSSIELYDHRFGRVRRIKDASERVEVFNLEVEGDNSYTADGVVVHNCQSFSVAGRRSGLDDARGVLAFEFLRLADRLRPRWLLFENVPGLLSSAYDKASTPTVGERIRGRNIERGSAFGFWLSEASKLGYGLAWGVLDAQHFGLAQRRERVFVAGYLGDWRPASAVLFDQESLSGYTAPSRAEKKEVAGTLGGGSGKRGWCADLDRATFLPTIAASLNANKGRLQVESTYLPVAVPLGQQMRGHADACAENLVPAPQPLFAGVVHGTQDPISSMTIGNALGRNSGSENVVAFHGPTVIPILEPGSRTGRSTNDRSIGSGIGEDGDPMFTLSQRAHGVAYNLRGREGGAQVEPCELASVRSASGGSSRTYVGVRRLTPVECEILQGLPPGYTLIPSYRKKAKERGEDAEALLRYYHRTEAGLAHVKMIDGRILATPDGPRYAAIGNSMAVPCLVWLAERITAVERIPK